MLDLSFLPVRFNVLDIQELKSVAKIRNGYIIILASVAFWKYRYRIRSIAEISYDSESDGTARLSIGL